MARTGFIQNELDLKLLVLYIMSRTAAPRNKAYKNKVALLQSKPWAVRFQNFLLEDMYLMYDIYASFLSEQGKLTLPDFGRSLSQTYLDNGKRSSEQKDQIGLFVRAIQSYPYNRSAYLALGKIVGYDNQELLKTYDYFMTSHHIKWYLNIVLSFEPSAKIQSVSAGQRKEHLCHRSGPGGEPCFGAQAHRSGGGGFGRV